MIKRQNEYGAAVDAAGYAPSIMQRGACCALCGRSWGAKMDRHEPWGGIANREKSKALGLWVTLCHFGCHEGPGSVHADAALALVAARLIAAFPLTGKAPNIRQSLLPRSKTQVLDRKRTRARTQRALPDRAKRNRECHEDDAQRAAMLRYGWSREEWIRRFGKSELSEDEAARIIPADATSDEIATISLSARLKATYQAIPSSSSGQDPLALGSCPANRGFQVRCDPDLPF